MHYLQLENDLEPSDGGTNQDEISEFIENDQRFIDYVIAVNLHPIPEDTCSECCPSQKWLDRQDFNPNDLIYEACAQLGWDSAPDNLCLKMNFQRIKDMKNI